MHLIDLLPSELTLDDLSDEELDSLVFMPEQRTQYKAQRAFVVRGGRKMKVQVRRRAGSLSPKQKAALRKARRKAHTGAANMKRRRSNKVRKRMHLKKVKGGVRRGSLARNR